jgi:extradiol dioxygenase family protein
MISAVVCRGQWSEINAQGWQLDHPHIMPAFFTVSTPAFKEKSVTPRHFGAVFYLGKDPPVTAASGFC